MAAAEDDVWGEGDESEELERESRRRNERLYTAGFRDGVAEGKERSVQEGFDQGFQEGAELGMEWGVLRGAVTSVTSLHENLNVPLDEEGRHKLSEIVTKMDMTNKEAMKVALSGAAAARAQATGDTESFTVATPPLNGSRSMQDLASCIQEQLKDLGFDVLGHAGGTLPP
ncbi:unnamed protein product [Ostreobium quekettii]|uniref:Essential protein Yae1 N-terminal domain-containing protein n=1 Tax=Ostreobium quekettii TaxID=121088 RepID=A0A8S1J3H5_9CHLO|nr:unnamed protein product [Ostreobium quekettii]|eukprot:evm.model.scf_548.2 EVM.evm.TU.scf_548.2   scf_548:42672-46417(-)